MNFNVSLLTISMCLLLWCRIRRRALVLLRKKKRGEGKRYIDSRTDNLTLDMLVLLLCSLLGQFIVGLAALSYHFWDFCFSLQFSFEVYHNLRVFLLSEGLVTCNNSQGNQFLVTTTVARKVLSYFKLSLQEAGDFSFSINPCIPEVLLCLLRSIGAMFLLMPMQTFSTYSTIYHLHRSDDTVQLEETVV